MGMVHRQELDAYMRQQLDPQGLTDYCPNGLQVEGRARIQHLVTGVTASQRFLNDAIAAGADAVLVHHGYFWKGEPAPIMGMKAERIRLLLGNDINLFAWHLPLDIHPQWGNNAQLAECLDIKPDAPVAAGGVPGLLWSGQLAQPLPLKAFAAVLAERLGRQPVQVAAGDRLIQRVAWCSGGGQRFIADAAALGVDAYFSGEISEPTAHEARELGLHYLAAGHHATERGGVQALGKHLAQHFGITHQFIDDPNPA